MSYWQYWQGGGALRHVRSDSWPGAKSVANFNARQQILGPRRTTGL